MCARLRLARAHLCTDLYEIFFDSQLRYLLPYELRFQREYLVNILIMHERHFHFLSVVADRLQDGPEACPQLWNESISAACTVVPIIVFGVSVINDKIFFFFSQRFFYRSNFKDENITIIISIQF